MIIGVTVEHLPDVWPFAADFIEKARTANADDYSLAEIYAELERKDAQLWVWAENNAITAAGITKITVYYNKKVCGLPYIGGKDVLKWLSAAETVISEWARAQGCTVMEGYARKGWLRVLPHWKPDWTRVRKSL